MAGTCPGTADEKRYMVRHPGPSLDFVKWVREKEIRWIGVDCGSADHPMNTKIRDWEPMEAAKCDKKFQEKYGKVPQRHLSVAGSLPGHAHRAVLPAV